MKTDSKLKALFYKLMLLLPDKWYIMLKFYKNFGHFPNLKSPITFSEKIQWLKLHDRNPLYTTMVDKYEAKKYVADIIGEEYIIPTLGVWDKAEDIDFDALPDQFVLKATHDSGRVIICRDKSTLDRNLAIEEMKQSLKRDFYSVTREWPYKNVPRRIIAEQLLVDETGTDDIKDYKLFCFDGNVKFLKVDFNRFIQHRANYFDKDWNLLEFGEKVCPPDPKVVMQRPDGLADMIGLAEELSKSLRFARTDFYYLNNDIYFGEITFYPSSGFGPFIPEGWDERLGKLIKLNRWGGVFN